MGGWLIIHGSTEFFAIVLAGAAGFRIGWSVVFPGEETRLAAATGAGRSAALVMAGVVVMLLFAGLLEGFGRQLIVNDGARYVDRPVAAHLLARLFLSAAAGRQWLKSCSAATPTPSGGAAWSRPRASISAFASPTAASASARFLIDLLIMAGILIAMTVLLFILLIGLIGFGPAAAEGVAIVWLLGFFLLRNFYFALMEMGPRAATFGKRAMGLRVVARSGERLTADRVIVRNLMREIEFYLPVTFLFDNAARGRRSALRSLSPASGGRRSSCSSRCSTRIGCGSAICSPGPG